MCYPFGRKHQEALGSETPRVHHAHGLGSGVAARGARAAAGEAGHRISRDQIARNDYRAAARFQLTAKRLDLLREMLPRASRIAVLVNPANTV